MANETRARAQALGFLPRQVATLSWALNAAATWLGYSFVLQQSRTLSKIQVYASAVNGVLGANDLTCDIYSDVNGVAVASLQSVNTVTATPAGAAHVEFTGFTQALTSGVRYWIVLKNVNATPAANYPTYLYGHEYTLASVLTGGPIGQANWGYSKLTTLDSGVTWATQAVNNTGSYRLEFNDATFAGFPIEFSGAEDTNTVYGTREVGVQFTMPAGPTFNMDYAALWIDKVGTPSNSLVYRIRDSARNLILESRAIPAGNVFGGAGYYGAVFPSTISLSPSGTYTLTLAELTNADAVANRYRTWYFQVENVASTLSLMPFMGTQRGIAFDGATWTVLPTRMFPFALGRNDTTPFVCSGGGGNLHLRLGL